MCFIKKEKEKKHQNREIKYLVDLQNKENDKEGRMPALKLRELPLEDMEEILSNNTKTR